MVCIKSILLFFLWFSLGHLCLAQQLLNGGFEINSQSGCGDNLPNLTYNNRMSASMAFGAKNEVDILLEACNAGSAYEGTYFIGLNIARDRDAVSLALDRPLLPGEFYAFTFFAKFDPQASGPGRLEIGISNQADQFGELLYTTPLVEREWTRYRVEFQADAAFEHLTIRPNNQDQAWIHVDAFSFECPTEIDLGPDTTVCDASDLSLGLKRGFDQYLWQDGSRNATFDPVEAGTYWVEVSQGNCSLSDTIIIAEFPNQCECGPYVPNAFSPNLDGVNDGFRAYSGCPFLYYKLEVYNRAGGLVFVSFDPTQAWDGRLNGKDFKPNAFVYVLRFSFEHDRFIRQKTGNFFLVR